MENILILLVISEKFKSAKVYTSEDLKCTTKCHFNSSKV